LSLKLSDTRVYGPQIRARLGTAAHFQTLVTPQVVLVSEREIALSVLRILEHEKAVVEGGGAAGLAALLPGTGPNPLYHRDDWVDRPRAMGG